MNIFKRLFFPISSFQIFLSISLLFNQPALGQEQVSSTQKISLGTYFSKGDYGVSEDTSIRYLPLSYELARFPWVLSIAAPYLALEGPGDVFLETGNIGRGREGESSKVNEAGIGDVNLSASYQFQPVFNDWVFVDFTLQAKIPTADESKDLGTGEIDYSYQLDFYSTLERNTYFSTFGYRVRGKTPLFDLQNTLFASLGYMRQFGENIYLGAVYDFRERASSNSFESHEIMPFISYNLGTQWNLMLYSIRGFTDSSADRAVGLQVSYTLP